MDGLDAIREKESPKPDTEAYYSIFYLIKKEKKLFYEVSFGTSDKDSLDKNVVNIDQIMASFKFLSKADFPVTTLTYKNNDLGFSFDYPINWLVNTFQNNGDYNKGFTLVNEDDIEMMTMFIQSRYYNCKQTNPPKNVIFGGKKAILTYDCDHPRVKIKQGIEFKLEVNLGMNQSTEWDNQLLEVLKSIQGLELIN